MKGKEGKEVGKRRRKVKNRTKPKTKKKTNGYKKVNVVSSELLSRKKTKEKLNNPFVWTKD